MKIIMSYIFSLNEKHGEVCLIASVVSEATVYYGKSNIANQIRSIGVLILMSWVKEKIY